ncbi:MAG: DUF3794 and LysM peptidoglycan-binding domain-containing protein [Candidatus Merdivicinus sp.]|jgi:hypothetical protein
MSQPELVRDHVCVTEKILDSAVEQSVELDYFLPDYYPNIFKLLKTSIQPTIQSCKIAGNQLVLDGSAAVRVLYLAEETNQICCVTQNIPFSKTVDLPSECRNPTIQIIPRCYFANGRAVNQRRLDIRGGISCKIRVYDQREQPVITGGSGSGMQFRQRRLSLCGPRQNGCKAFVITEDLELGSSKPPFANLLGYYANAIPTEIRVIANKAICKADLQLHLLYLPEGESCKPEIMEFSLPISQIVDLPGVGENAACNAKFEVTGLSLEPKTDEEGTVRVLSCEFSILLCCTADQNQDIVLVDDAYSTLYETSVSARPAAAELFLQNADLTVTTRNTIDTPNPVSAVCDVWASFGEYSIRLEEGTLSMTGNLEVSVLCIGNDGIPFLFDKTIPVELRLLSGLEAHEISFLPQIQVLSCGYAILSETSLEVRAELRVSGPLYEQTGLEAMTDITVEEEKPRVRDHSCALRICYAEAGDCIWDIAKSYATSMAAVLEENNLETEQLDARTMLLIPLIDG